MSNQQLWNGVEPAASAGLSADQYGGALENIVLKSRASILLQVVGEDPVYVVGYFCDIRALRVSTDLVRVAKREITLRIVQDATPHPDSIRFKGAA